VFAFRWTLAAFLARSPATRRLQSPRRWSLRSWACRWVPDFPDKHVLIAQTPLMCLTMSRRLACGRPMKNDEKGWRAADALTRPHVDLTQCSCCWLPMSWQISCPGLQAQVEGGAVPQDTARDSLLSSPGKPKPKTLVCRPRWRAARCPRTRPGTPRSGLWRR
jgi:hypothetical protein